VKQGQTLVVMEAMKMEHAIGAPHDGTVTEIRAVANTQVDGGALLAIVE
jgi:biotin carboxyl carrier protein